MRFWVVISRSMETPNSYITTKSHPITDEDLMIMEPHFPISCILQHPVRSLLLGTARRSNGWNPRAHPAFSSGVSSPIP